jgi:hypothetical protein
MTANSTKTPLEADPRSRQRRTTATLGFLTVDHVPDGTNDKKARVEMSAHELQEIRVIADLALTSTTDQLLVSQRQYVDVLLDLRSVAMSPVLRSTIDDRLRDIRFVTMIDASEVSADLEAIVAISEVEDEFEMAWAEIALTCDCHECTTTMLTHEARSVTTS